MNILKTIFDFILSFSRLFFRRKAGKRQYCAQCGSLLRPDRSCRYCERGTGNSPGSGRGDYDDPPEPEGDPREEKETPYAEAHKPLPQAMTPAGAAGWCLFVAAWVMAVFSS